MTTTSTPRGDNPLEQIRELALHLRKDASYITGASVYREQYGAPVAGTELYCAPPASPAGVPDVWREVLAELDRATKKFPTWPTDPLHAVAVLNEEVGELNKAVLQAVYEPHKNPTGAVRSEATQAAAMALRFIASIGRYTFTRGQQHALSAEMEQAHE